VADIRHMIRIAAAPARVYPLVATPEGLARWWAEDVEKADGVVRLGFFKRQTVYNLRLIESQPTRVTWRCESGDEWSGTELRFELADSAGATMLRFTHANWKADTDYYVMCTTTWGDLMFRLAAEAEGRVRGPLFKRESLAY
jgi:uncharacterized protein YndB with AHSA1/START domain